jgi:LacI family transcriptional regulator
MRKTRATIKEVAAITGVHASTVSRVLNPETRKMVSEKVAEKVLRVARELGYLRNPLASGLRTRRSHTVGVLIPDLSNPLFPPIVRGIERVLDKEGYIVVLADSENSERTEHALVENLVARQVDGLILATAHRKDPVVEECIEHNIPLVLVNRTVDKHNVTSVINDDEYGIRLVLQHLSELGHDDIAFVGGPQNTSTGHARYRAFLSLCKEMRLKVSRDIIVNGNAFSEAAGRAALNQILDKSVTPFTAVVAANDLLALGCLDVLAERGLNCPRDISITGFNHMPFIDRINPSMTTISIPHTELGMQAAYLLLERLRHPEKPSKTLRLRPSLIVGGSTQPRTMPVKKRRSSRVSRAIP